MSQPITFEAAIAAMRADPAAASIRPFVQLVAALRPRRAAQLEEARHRLRSLTLLLGKHPDDRTVVRDYLLALFGRSRLLQLLTDSGILANQGFWSAVGTRLGAKLLPEEHRDDAMISVIGQAFHRRDDFRWVGGVEVSLWRDLWQALDIDAQRHGKALRGIALDLIEAIQVLSYRVSAMGLEPELIKIHPAIEQFESPFLTQNVAVRDYLEHAKARIIDPGIGHENDRHIRVLLAQCDDIEARVRKTMAREGVSISLTYLMVRLRQHIDRLRLLLDLLDPEQSQEAPERAVTLFQSLIQADNRKTSLRDLLATNTDMLALQITQHAGRTGEHYIAADRAEWKSMAQSAMGAGFIVGFMALLKLLIAKLKFAPLIEAFAFSMNYSLGFMLVHVLHFTIATKQPAMTAASIAAHVEQNRGGKDSPEGLVDLIESVARTQFISIVGNVSVALPTAFAIASAMKYLFHLDWISADKAQHLLHDLDPVHSLAVPHAAIAGCCLFLAGLISGYYDNKAVYNRIPARLMQLRWPKRVLGEARWRRACQYIENNLGALAGNFFFGIMLGSIGTIGYLLGLPIDIRHITFAAANLAYAAVALDFHLTWQAWLLSGLGIALIGLTNLAVSFSLALFVALRARGTRIHHYPQILKALLLRLLRSPGRFFVAPKAGQVTTFDSVA